MNCRRIAALLMSLMLLICALPAALAADEAPLTRAEMIVCLWEAAGSPEAEGDLFEDVAAEADYSGAVRWAAAQGITNGTGSGFSPDVQATRATLVTFLWRQAGSPAPEAAENPFADVAEDAWYRDAALWAAETGLIGAGEAFEPALPVTAAELAALLNPADEPEEPAEEKGIDYLALVNKLNPLPEGWEDALDIVETTNSLEDEIEVERAAYEAYLALKAALAEEGVYVDLDSARRSVAAQQDIMDRFTEKYGADYAAKTVATPGYSEHHTGLALDLYLNIDGKDVYYNEDMVQYPEIWAKIHEKLADYGFILRYLEGKEHITGYGYEPWHIRYVKDPEIAREIMSKPGMTLEVWLGAVTDPEVEIDLGSSEIFTEEELEAAVVQIKCRFASWAGCELHSIRYAGDESVSDETLAWLNSLNEDAGYTQAVEFLMDFHSPVEAVGAWEPDSEYTDYQWWLARTAEGGWNIVTWGY